MQKDKLSLPNIKEDLGSILSLKVSISAEWRMAYILPTVIISLILIFALKHIWIGILILLFPAYHIFRFVLEYRQYSSRKKALMNALERGDISISVEKLSHLSEETIYEPRFGSRRNIREISVLYFMSGCSWRIPYFLKHYSWSSNYYLSTEGLKNIAVPGNEYFYVTLQGNSDIAYVYPRDFFELDENLKRRQGGN